MIFPLRASSLCLCRDSHHPRLLAVLHQYLPDRRKPPRFAPIRPTKQYTPPLSRSPVPYLRLNLPSGETLAALFCILCPDQCQYPYAAARLYINGIFRVDATLYLSSLILVLSRTRSFALHTKETQWALHNLYSWKERLLSRVPKKAAPGGRKVNCMSECLLLSKALPYGPPPSLVTLSGEMSGIGTTAQMPIDRNKKVASSLANNAYDPCSTCLPSNAVPG